MFIIYFFILFF